MDADGKAGRFEHIRVVDVVADGQGLFIRHAQEIGQFVQASSFVDALVHKFDITVAGEADRDIAQEGLEFGVYPLQIVIVRIGHDELADFFLTADEIEALRFDRHVPHAAVEEGFFIGCDIRDIDDITRIDMHTLTVCTAATENPVGQVERNGIPEKGSAALIFRNMGPIKTNDILVRLVVEPQSPQDAFDGTEPPARTGNEFYTFGDGRRNGFDVALANRRIAAEQRFIHITSNDFILHVDSFSVVTAGA